jgi:O-Antigen ligase
MGFIANVPLAIAIFAGLFLAFKYPFAATEVPQKRKRWALLFVVAYLWMLIATPQERFPFLGEIHLERILIFAAFATLLLSGKVQKRGAAITVLLMIFFSWMMISHFASPYRDFFYSQVWIEDYWKVLVLYFLILLTVEDLDDLFYIFGALVIISLAYQLHSWRDFLNGGSYQWEQGVKRIVGVWVRRGAGAPNAFAFLALLSIPFAIFWLSLTEKKNIRLLMLSFILLCCLSILFSGTRAALVVAVVYLFWAFRKHLKLRMLIPAAAVVAILVTFLPDELKHRYFDLIFYENYEAQNSFDRSAISSAEGRIEGIKDGWRLVLRRPILGYGPGSSAIARTEINRFVPFRGDDDPLQLHNLYAQLLAETGFVGGLIFLGIIITYFKQLQNMTRGGQAETLSIYKNVLQDALLVLLLYGMSSHNLYRHDWMILFACQSAFIAIVCRMHLEKSNDLIPIPRV